MTKPLTLCLLMTIMLSSCKTSKDQINDTAKAPFVIIGYVPGFRSIIDEKTIDAGYTFVKDSIMSRPGFVRHWDNKAKAPYLFNEKTRQLVSYDDEESIKIKCEYVKEHNMAGVMFWQYASDPKGYLLTAINENR